MLSVLRAMAYLRRHWQLTLLAIISLTAATLLSLAVPQILRDVIDQGLPLSWPQAIYSPRFLADGLQVISPRPQLIFQAAILLFGLSLLRPAVAFGQRFYGERLSQYVAYDIRNDFYDHVQHLPFSYHDQSQMGQIITRAITDIETIRTFIAQGMIDGLNAAILIVGVMVTMLILSPSLTVVALLPVPLIILLAIRMGFVQL